MRGEISQSSLPVSLEEEVLLSFFLFFSLLISSSKKAGSFGWHLGRGVVFFMHPGK